MQIGSADRARGQPHDRIVRLFDFRVARLSSEILPISCRNYSLHERSISHYAAPQSRLQQEEADASPESPDLLEVKPPNTSELYGRRMAA